MMLQEFHAPETVGDAVRLLKRKRGSLVVLAGGTDVMVRARRGSLPESVTGLLSLHRIPAMRGVRREGEELAIGAATTASDLIDDALLAHKAPILARVADRMASHQIRNQATLGGNVVNASPAGDLINPLLLLDARLILVSAESSRSVMIEDFFSGPGECVLHEQELLFEIRLPIPDPERVFVFEKAGTRPAMECSVLTVGCAWTPMAETSNDVRVTFGSAAPTPIRGRRAEAALEGRPRTIEVIESAVRAADSDVNPICDVRGSETYRRALAGVFLRRLLNSKPGAAGADKG